MHTKIIEGKADTKKSAARCLHKVIDGSLFSLLIHYELAMVTR